MLALYPGCLREAWVRGYGCMCKRVTIFSLPCKLHGMGSGHHLISPVGQHHTTHSPLQHQPPTPHHPFLWGGGGVEEVQGGTVSEDNTNVSTGVGHKTAETWNMGCVELVGREEGGGGGLWGMRRGW